jgi:hypothetical protein
MDMDNIEWEKRVKKYTVLLSELPPWEQEPFWDYIESAPRSIPPLLPEDPQGDKRVWLADYRRFKIYPDGEAKWF